MDILQSYFEILSHFPGYERRKAQEDMVSAVWQGMTLGESMVIEAGTGSGKSFGYLIPALLQSQRPVIISTGTIALQEQLLDKDIPFLGQSHGLKDLLENPEINVKMVKGRRNYLCLQKMTEFERELKPQSREMMHIDRMKSQFADKENPWDGDRHTLDFTVPQELWDNIQSETEDCLNRKCRFYQENPYRSAREDLDKADIIIANHALYLQDVMSGQSMLPPHDIVIFDEAHNLKRYALNAFTSRIGKFATTKLLQKIQRRLKAIPEEYMREITVTESAILHCLFQNYSSVNRGAFRLAPNEAFREAVQTHMNILQEIYHWLTSLKVNQLALVETDLDKDKAKVQREKLLKQLEGLMGRWEHFLYENPFDHDRVNWVEINKERLYFELKSTPLNISQIMGEKLWPEKVAVLTSATLSMGNSLGFIKQDLGLPDKTKELVLPSPFDYQSQCTLYIPHSMPEPNSEEFVWACAEQIEALLHKTQGRGFVLFTSRGNMLKIAEALIPKLPYPCRVQGDMPRNRLIDWFKGTKNSVLFATATFWEGIDIPGEALSCVIMDKIPFSPPDDPVNQATVEYLKSKGQDWFGGFVLPQATIRMKQGFGRLIRSQTDRGIVAILDPRMRTKGYGKRIERSLPQVRVASHLEALSLREPPQAKVEDNKIEEGKTLDKTLSDPALVTD